MKSLMSTTTVNVSIQRICNKRSEMHEESYTYNEKLKILPVNVQAKNERFSGHKWRFLA